jgi:hypothetical protein
MCSGARRITASSVEMISSVPSAGRPAPSKSRHALMTIPASAHNVAASASSG